MKIKRKSNENQMKIKRNEGEVVYAEKLVGFLKDL